MAVIEWRIDAWAVRDGAAFASRRAAESRVAENTIFIAVPDLEPVPVGRMSTALAATRRNFQSGLRDYDHEEVEFESIDQIVELVRRGFLASGLGPGGSAAPLPTRGPVPPGDAGGEMILVPGVIGPRPTVGTYYYENAILDAHHLTWRQPDLSVKSGLEHFASSMRSHDGHMASALREVMAGYAEAITIDWEDRVAGEDDPSDVRMLIAWYHALYEIGIWDGDSIGNFLKQQHCHWGHQVWDIWPTPYWNGAGLEAGTAPSRRQLISYAPCPRRNAWVPGLRRLADKLTLPMCIGNYFDNNPELPELAPATLAAMLLTGSNFPSAYTSGSRYLVDRLGTALRWLAGETPIVELPEVAEQLINDYAWSLVEEREHPGPASVPMVAPLAPA